jgi:hypothetical protein
MKYKNVFWGIALLTIGVLFALRNLDIIFFNWDAVFHLWPLIFVLWGISILPVKPLIKLLLSAIVGVAAIVLVYTNPGDGWNPNWFNWQDGDISINDDYDRDYTPADQNLFEPFDSTVTRATLDLDAAAGTFILKDTTNQMVDFKSEGNIGPYVMTSYDNDGGRKIKITMEGVKINTRNSRNQVTLRMNNKPVWDVSIDAGAAKMDLDLSNYKIASLELDGGASDLDLKLGELTDTVRVSLEMGASSVTVRIPKTLGCEVTSESVLSSRKLDNFDKVRSGFYRSKNYNATTKKVFIDMEAAVSSLTIEEY